MCPEKEHLSHKGLNNRVKNAHQPTTRRKEKSLIKFKSPQEVQRSISLMGKLRNIFSVDVGRYSQRTHKQRNSFRSALFICSEAALMSLQPQLWMNEC
jgi:putative transposase